jgi:uncharacterized protein (DUF1697 family)
MAQYVALLRGINVGGKNLIKMPALKACFEAGGFRKVATYIQSGNVLFESSETSSAGLVRRIEEMLTAAFNYRASVVLRTRKQMHQVVEHAPERFGAQPARYRYDVLFLKPPLSAAAAVKTVPSREGVDQVRAGSGVLYFSRLIARISQSQISRIASIPIYQSLTIRNWNTTTKLMELMDVAARGATPPSIT